MVHLIKSDKPGLGLQLIISCPSLLYTGMPLTRPLSHKPRTVSIHHFECLNSCLSGQTDRWSLENWSNRKTVIMPKSIHEPFQIII